MPPSNPPLYPTELPVRYLPFFPQRFSAAFFAIAFLFAAVSFSALALPPLDAPSFDNATAAGFRVSCSGGGSAEGGTGLGPLPVAASATAFAIWVKSIRLLAREGMRYNVAPVHRGVNRRRRLAG